MANSNSNRLNAANQGAGQILRYFPELLPEVGEHYIQKDGGMVAIIKERTTDRVVFSYEQYPLASHDYSLSSFVRDFNRLKSPASSATNEVEGSVRYVITPDNLKFYCRQLCKVALRYADDAEVLELTSCFEQIASLMVNGNFGVAASMPANKRSDYCYESCKIVTRHATPSELNKISLVIEIFIATMLAGNYRPGLNSAAYEVYNKYVLRDRAINNIVSQKLDEIAQNGSVNHSPRMGGNDHE